MRKATAGRSTSERLLTVSELALLANCSAETVRRHVRKGALAVVHVGPTHRIRVTLQAAREYLGECYIR